MSHQPEQITQTTLPLKVSSPYSFRYFVPHSGVAEAYQHLLELLRGMYFSKQDQFSMTYIFGPASSGKQHLLAGFEEQLVELGVEPDRYFISLLPESRLAETEKQREIEPWEARFVAAYERLRAQGGAVVVAGEYSPDEVQLSPHTKSRLLAGRIFSVTMPDDSELRPVVRSLLERHNLRLSEYSLDFLIKRLPRDLLSFDQIFDKIDEISLPSLRPATLSTVREALKTGSTN